MMEKLIIIFTIGLIGLTSCSSRSDKQKESTEFEVKRSNIIDLEVLKQDKVIYPGIGIGNLIIGETSYEQLITAEADRKKYYEEGFEFHFEKGKILKEIILHNTGEYLSESGDELGKSKNEVLNVLGEPITSNLSLNKEETQIGQVNSLNYDGVTFILQDTIVTMIIVTKKQ